MKILHTLLFALVCCFVLPAQATMTLDEAAIATIEVRDFAHDSKTTFTRCLVFFDNMTLNVPESNALTAKCRDTESTVPLSPQDQPVEPTFHTLYEAITMDTGWMVPAPPQNTLEWKNCTLSYRRYQLTYPTFGLPVFAASYKFDCGVE